MPFARLHSITYVGNEALSDLRVVLTECKRYLQNAKAVAFLCSSAHALELSDMVIAGMCPKAILLAAAAHRPQHNLLLATRDAK